MQQGSAITEGVSNATNATMEAANATGNAITEGVSNATNATMGAVNETGNKINVTITNSSQGNPILDALKNLFGGMSRKQIRHCCHLNDKNLFFFFFNTHFR